MLFSEVVAQTSLASRLREGVRSEKVAHAQLFDGSEGSGALALARAYAQYLHCTDRIPEDSCGKCASCVAHSKLQHPDLHWSFPFFKKDSSGRSISDPFQSDWRESMLDTAYFGIEDWLGKIGADKKQLFISVDEALEINRKLGLKAFHGGYKVLILWLPETMRVDTANKLLKLIEEPTDNTVMLFVSNSSDRLLPTILSRLQRIKVPRLSDAEAATGLLKLRGVSEDSAMGWVHVTEGNITAANRLARTGSETPDLELFSSWMRACWVRDAEAMMRQSNDFAAPGREAQKRFITYALHMVRQSIVGNYGAPSLVRLTPGEKAFLSKFSKFIHHKNVVKISSLLEAAHKDIAGNVNSKVVFMDLSVQIHILLRKEAA
ncbi:MAG: DNA polymerase III subunit delta [Crocinitomicaceae bacterium]|nr:DNA polymerase III subunit delta [Crocinitomicaceae bacterium]|tara:strand:- start:3189 stop:4319 length:1131 start_codon:yes stop_codon:yes gene_type:complete